MSSSDQSLHGSQTAEDDAEIQRRVSDFRDDFDRRLVALQENVSTHAMRMEIHIQKLLQKMLEGFRLRIEDSREKFNEFVRLVDVMFSDIRKGALICISTSLKTVSRAPVSRKDRTTLWELRQKWHASLGPQLTHQIVAAGETSLFGSFSPGRPDDSQKVAAQCQTLIHSIWSLVGDDRPEPDILSMTTFGVRFEAVIQEVITVMENRLLELHQQIRDLEKAKTGRLHPSVEELILEVKRAVVSSSQRLHREHLELVSAMRGSE
jgi:hypothetical protein